MVKLLFDTFEFVLLAGGMAALYHYVPNTTCKWAHAWAGGLFVAAAIEIAKRVLGYYLSLVPTYSVLYGAFATVPILLVWIYVAWVIVLFGAVIAAYLPSLLAGVARRGGVAGWPFQLAVEVLQHLRRAPGHAGQAAWARPSWWPRMRVDALQLAPVLETLVAHRLDRAARRRAATTRIRATCCWPTRPRTPLEPLLRELLHAAGAAARRACGAKALWMRLLLQDLLPNR